jgi:hypothetical protein
VYCLNRRALPQYRVPCDTDELQGWLLPLWKQDERKEPSLETRHRPVAHAAVVSLAKPLRTEIWDRLAEELSKTKA